MACLTRCPSLGASAQDRQDDRRRHSTRPHVRRAGLRWRSFHTRRRARLKLTHVHPTRCPEPSEQRPTSGPWPSSSVLCSSTYSEWCESHAPQVQHPPVACVRCPSHGDVAPVPRTSLCHPQNTGIIVPPYLFSFFNLLDVLLLTFAFVALVLHVKIAVQVSDVFPEDRDGHTFVNAYQIAADKLLFVRAPPTTFARATAGA